MAFTFTTLKTAIQDYLETTETTFVTNLPTIITQAEQRILRTCQIPDLRKNETWRKVLNNLMYIYKTKGTINSVNALLNTYGYPSEALEIQEIGGSSEEMNPIIISNEVNDKELEKGGLNRSTGSIHFVNVH